MTGRVLRFLVAATCLGCGGTTSVAPQHNQRFCELTTRIDKIYGEADDTPLSPDAERRVSEAVHELGPLVPADYSNDYRLRYWPTTDISGLDTSGTTAQRAYDRMQALFNQTCGSG